MWGEGRDVLINVAQPRRASVSLALQEKLRTYLQPLDRDLVEAWHLSR